MAEQQKRLKFRKQHTNAKPGTLAKAKGDVSFLAAKTKAAENQKMPGGYVGSLVQAKGNAAAAVRKRSHGSDERTTQARRDAVRDRYKKKGER